MKSRGYCDNKSTKCKSVGLTPYNKGFTLIELVVTLLVLSMGLITILLMVRQASVNNSTSQFITIAGKLAQEKMEEIINDRKTQGFGYITEANYPSESPVSGFSTYSRSVNIFYVSSSDFVNQAGSSTNYKRVGVTLSGEGGTGTSVELVTLATNY